MSIPKIEELFDLSHTVAAPLLAACSSPWEALPRLGDFLAELIASLAREEYEEREDGVFIHRTATVAPSACIVGPTVIGARSEVRHCAYIRGKVLVGEGCVVGNSSEIKNSILFDGVQVPHYNYVGDSILGYRAHMGAGSITSNVRSDKDSVSVHADGERIETGLRKLGAMLGDRAELGCGSVCCPGAIVGRDAIVYPLSLVRGTLNANTILKEGGRTAPRRSETKG